MHSTWSDNPQFYLFLPPPVSAKPKVQILLKLLHGWDGKRKRDPLNTMIGVYLLQCPKGAQLDPNDETISVARAVRQPLNDSDYRARLVEATFLPNSEAVITIDTLAPSKNPYLIVPATFGREKTGSFSLEVTSNVEIFLLEGISAFSASLHTQ